MAESTESHPQDAIPPGPWKVIEAGGFWVVPESSGHRMAAVIPVPLDNEVLAHFIAAAPDLAKRLEFAEMLLDGGKIGLAGIPWREAWAKLQALSEPQGDDR